MRATIAHAASRVIETEHRRPEPAHKAPRRSDILAAKSPVTRNLIKVRNAFVRIAH
jgi:hypothetical protein